MEIQNLSKDIIEKQTRQIAKMKDMYDTCCSVVNNNRDIDLYIRSYNLYFENMIHGMERSCTGNNLDIDFLTEMIPHHEGAINMASNLLRFGICEKLKAIGENIVEDESAQLEQMKVLLKNMTLRNRY